MKYLKTVFLSLLVFAPLLLGGCGKIEDIKVTSCGIESITPVGLRGLKAELAIAVDNPAMQFTLSDIKGVLYYKGVEFVKYDADPILVRRHTAAVYPLNVAASLADNVNFTAILSLVGGYDINDFSTDIHAKVKLKSGLSKKFIFKNIPVKDLM